MSVMVERLRCQGDRVVGGAGEHVKYHIDIVNKDGVDLLKNLSRKELMKPVGDPCD